MRCCEKKFVATDPQFARAIKASAHLMQIRSALSGRDVGWAWRVRTGWWAARDCLLPGL